GLAGCAGTLVATLYIWWRTGNPDFTMTVNGCLAGLVSITAPCAYVSGGSAIVIGSIAGVLVVEAPRLFDRLHLDDPVAATSVHLVHGIFGTLCVGLFGIKGQSGLPHDGLLRGGGATQLLAQAEAVVTVGAFSFATSLLAWIGIKKMMGLRITAEHEIIGLDLSEMGMEAYADAIELERSAREETATTSAP
ncbi:MAG TPA: ammonium transporter, partial [Polyangia bacterium]